MTTSAVNATLPLAARNFRVSSPLLLSLYLIIPFCAVLVVADTLWFGHQLRDVYLPSNPATLLVWAVVFNFPHIVSSLVTLADDEYIPFYRQRFTRALLIISIAVLTVNVLFPLLFPRNLAVATHFLFFGFFATYTMYHVLSQQFGIGMMLMRARPGGRGYEAWRWLATLAATTMYGLVFVPYQTQKIQLGGMPLYQLAEAAAGVLVLLAVIQGFRLSRQSQRRLGSWYIYSNLVMLLATYTFLKLDYGIFVIAIPRFVHDLTAFIIYSTHDQNRNREVQHNYIYRALSFLKIPPLVLCPILAIVLANTIECGAFLFDMNAGFVQSASECVMNRFYTPATPANGLPQSMQLWLQIMFICGFFHYYIEGFVWKREAIHRHSVTFS